MPNWKQVIGSVFKRSHPDIYQATKAYAEAKGIKVDDVVGAAVSAYLSADDEGKEKLEAAIAERRETGGGVGNIKATMGLMKDFLGMFTEFSKSMAESRAAMQVSSVVADYQAISEAAKKIGAAGAESGSGTMEDVIGKAIIGNILTGLGAKKEVASQKKVGTAPVQEIGED